MLFRSCLCLTILLLFSACEKRDLTNPNDPQGDLDPQVPTELTAVAVTDSKIQLEWIDNGPKISFVVRRRLAVDTSFEEIGRVGPDSTTFIDTTVYTGNSYVYRVASLLANGKEAFAEISIDHVFPAPADLSLISISPTSIQLTWQDNAFFPVQFQIERYTGEIVTTIGIASDKYFVDSNALLGTEYEYRVAAVTARNRSSDVVAYINHILPGPTNLIGSLLSIHEISLVWNDNAEFESAYWIERSEADNAYTLLDSLVENSTSYIDTTATVNTTYRYKVRCGIDSSYSAYAEGDIFHITFGPPSDVHITSLSDQALELSWHDHSNVETGFQVEQSINGGAYAEVTSVNANTVTWIDSMIQVNDLYSYRVSAVADGGVFEVSDGVSAAFEAAWSNDINESAFDVSFLSMDIGWAVGYSGALFNTIDGGRNWAETTLPTGASLSAVVPVDEQNVWVAAGNSTLYTTTDGGNTWTFQAVLGPVNSVLGMYFMDPQTGVAVGSWGLVRRMGSGSNWETVIDTKETYQVIRGITSSNSRYSVAVGNSGGIWVTFDAWDSWTYGPYDSGAMYYGVFSLDVQHTWICGTKSDDGVILFSSDSGQTWHEQFRALGSSTPSRLQSIHFVDLDTGWAVGNGGTLLKTTNGGQIWEAENLELSYGYGSFESVYFLDSHHGWIADSGPTGGVWCYLPRWVEKN